MCLVVIILLALILLGAIVSAAGLITALLIARHELKQHNERWRFG